MLPGREVTHVHIHNPSRGELLKGQEAILEGGHFPPLIPNSLSVAAATSLARTDTTAPIVVGVAGIFP